MLVPLLARWLRSVTPEWEPPVEPPTARELSLLAAPRTPGFCAGCPHNLSTTVPDGSLALGGIGCHGMAVECRSATRWRTRRWAARAPPG